MSDVQEMSQANWRQLEFEWRLAQNRWHDSTTEYFRTRFMDPLDYGMRNHLRALDELIETLRQAQDVARHR